VDDYDSFSANQIKHLEMIQAVIARLGNDGFLVKGWTVTVVGAFLGFAVNDSDATLALASVVPAVAFWSLDTYFLRSERLFRELYERVRSGEHDGEAFSMGATTPEFVESLGTSEIKSWWATFLRPVLWRFYGGLAVSAGIVAATICAG
jgi:hypothetical protein